MKRAAEGAAGVPDPLTREVLAATVAHELNNIVASLHGFVQLAIESAGPESAAGNFLGEVTTGVERIVALGADLQMFASAPGGLTRVALRECFDGRNKEHIGSSRILWNCDPATTVLVNAHQVRSILGALTEQADRAGGAAAKIRCDVLADTSRSECLACGESVADNSVWLSMAPVTGMRGPPRSAARASRAFVSGPELRAVALAHLAHCAGGHLVLGPAPGTLSLVLPTS